MYSLSKDEQFNLYKVCLLVVAGWKFYESCEFKNGGVGEPENVNISLAVWV